MALRPDELPSWFYSVHVKELIAHRVLAARPAGQRPRLNPRQLAWARGRADAVISALRTSGYHVAGTLDDLLPAEAAKQPRAPLEAADVTDAAVDALATLLRDEFDPARRRRALELAHGPSTTRLVPSRRTKRFLRNLSTRSAALRGLRVAAWRWSERWRARRRHQVRGR